MKPSTLLLSAALVVASACHVEGRPRVLQQIPTSACAFDIDRTLTAAQSGGCSDAIPVPNAVDNAYRLGDKVLPLMAGGFSEKAVQTCIQLGFGVSLVTQAPDCSSGTLNGDAGKLKWLNTVVQNAGGSVGWVNVKDPKAEPAPFVCGLASKSQLLDGVKNFWQIDFPNIVYFDDQQDNIDLVVKEKGVKAQLASSTRPSGDTCRDVASKCCGLSETEFKSGVSLLQAEGGAAATATSAASFQASTSTVTLILSAVMALAALL